MPINIRYLVAIFLILVIGGFSIVIYNNKDTLFKHEIMVRFPDGCVEKYVNGKLITPNCSVGREMQERGTTSIWNINPDNLIVNPNLVNLTI